MAQWRHEIKHALSAADAYILAARLRAVLRADPHAPDGVYTVRSLYFDTPDDAALRQKLAGVDRREKFRLRLYNGDTTRLLLERKAKQGGLSQKQQAELTLPEAEALLQGDTAWMPNHPAPLVRALYARLRCQGLRPCTLVEYRRQAFVYDPGGAADVRVTLDSALHTGLRGTDFLAAAPLTVPAPGPAALLEVKWSAYLPQAVCAAVQAPGCRAEAFSKYAACRLYDLG